MSVVRAAVVKPGRGRIAYDDDPAVGEENLFNQVQSQYNDFGQLTAQYQAHGGAVNTSTTPNVEDAYADGSANTIRPTSLTYPNGRVLNYSYGTSGGIDDAQGGSRRTGRGVSLKFGSLVSRRQVSRIADRLAFGIGDGG